MYGCLSGLHSTSVVLNKCPLLTCRPCICLSVLTVRISFLKGVWRFKLSPQNNKVVSDVFKLPNFFRPLPAGRSRFLVPVQGGRV